VTRLLLAGGASPSLKNKRGLTALGEAVAAGHVPVAKAIVDWGRKTASSSPAAAVSAPPAEASCNGGGAGDVCAAAVAAFLGVKAGGGGYSLLHIAAGMGQAGSLSWLIEQDRQHADAAGIGRGGDGSKAGGARGGDGGLLDVNDRQNEDGMTPLHAAVMGGSAECVELLIKAGE
jgi:ankyrin repeat protein